MYDPARYLNQLDETVLFLKERFGLAPRTAAVLGSGLGDFVDKVADRTSVDYAQIPNFPRSSVVGHSGRLTVLGSGDRALCTLQGRVHFYEGLPAWEIVYAVRALARWGIQSFVITNAAGAVNTQFRPGNLMLISDHLNLLGDNPLVGPNIDALGDRFPDVTEAYSLQLRAAARTAARKVGIELKEGVYAAVKGPSYETPAEIRMLRTIGADAVGMSTVPEVIALNQMGKRVLGISCITNMAAGILQEKMVHDDVLKVTREARDDFANMILQLQQEMLEI